MSTRLLFVHALSPLHAGTGQSVGAIDLATARDRATGLPYLAASGLKGSLRARAEGRLSPGHVKDLFGPDWKNAADQSGSMVFGDANLLLLPARSVAGTFAWVTSPYIVRRLLRDAAEAKLTALCDVQAPSRVEDCRVAAGCVLEAQVGGQPRVVLDDLDLEPVEDEAVSTLATALGRLLFPGDTTWQRMLTERVCLVHDDVMAFLSRHATDVQARVRLSSASKTVEEGPWYEENLPVETVLVVLAAALPHRRCSLDAAGLWDKLGQLVERPLQLGGNETVGRGRCRVVLAQGGEA